MTPPDPAYRKLPGRGLGWSGLARLWLADDHLLEVSSLLFHERYRRFFLPDIAALIVRRTKVRLYWNLVHGFFGIGGALVIGGLIYGATFIPQEEARVVLYVFAGMIAPFAVVALILLLVNSLLGPTCRCHIQTAAGWHPLAAPSRLRNARRLLAQVAPLLEAAQVPPAAIPPPLATAERF